MGMFHEAGNKPVTMINHDVICKQLNAQNE